MEWPIEQGGAGKMLSQQLAVWVSGCAICYVSYWGSTWNLTDVSCHHGGGMQMLALALLAWPGWVLYVPQTGHSLFLMPPASRSDSTPAPTDDLEPSTLASMPWLAKVWRESAPWETGLGKSACCGHRGGSQVLELPPLLLSILPRALHHAGSL